MPTAHISAQETVFWPIVGQAAAVGYLQELLRLGLPAPSYLFCGPAQIGKATLARTFARALVCASTTAQPRPCERCPGCTQSARDAHPDVTTLRPVSAEEGERGSVGMEAMRGLLQSLSLSPLISSVRVAIIEDVDACTAEAVHALLKTLEEPSPRAVLILTTSASQRLPKTIASRCVQLHLRPAPQAEVVQWLEQRGYSTARAAAATQAAHGRTGAALGYCQSDDASADSAACIADIRTAIGGTLEDGFRVMGEWSALDATQLAHQLSVFEALLRDALLGMSGITHGMSYPAQVAALQSSVERLGNAGILRALDALSEARMRLRAHGAPKLVLESFILNFYL